MGLRDIGHTLPPGFRFYPSDEELVCHYLYKKIANEQSVKGTLVEIDLHTCQPWQLPDVARLNSSEWYFFSFRDRKYATGFRANRATTLGYWKATGKDRPVLNPGTRAVTGMRKTLVFYKNRAPHGLKTEWIMHEFRLENPHAPPKEEWVLCRVFHKSRGQNCNQQDNLGDDQYSNNNNLALTTNEHEHEHALASYDYQNTNSYDQVHNTNTYPLGLAALEHPSTSSTHLHNNYSKLLLSDQTKCEDDDYGFLFDCLNYGASLNFDMI